MNNFNILLLRTYPLLCVKVVHVRSVESVCMYGVFEKCDTCPIETIALNQKEMTVLLK